MRAELFLDSGKVVDAFTFTLEDLTIWGVARALAKINRFSGNGDEFEYVSVAQHSVNLSYLVPPGLEKAALLHDICEIFIGDIPSPIKAICPAIMEIEEKILRNVSDVFEVPYSKFLELKPFDSAIGKDEARFLFPDAPPDLVSPERGLGITVITMDTKKAALAWMNRFHELYMLEGSDYDNS